ncbi:hypothetical protein EYF80_005902 [Liparis tanakae]|uniref:Uncharacterized protein n=1 Tax=Liparis tanakae TaxID=230148 RepID=A0A4Z2J0P1_9TELE|nr:hypothetical protein EYF80_005902 [Liparis tanakae]
MTPCQLSVSSQTLEMQPHRHRAEAAPHIYHHPKRCGAHSVTHVLWLTCQGDNQSLHFITTTIIIIRVVHQKL